MWTTATWVDAYVVTARGVLLPPVRQDLGSPHGATVEAGAGGAILVTADNSFVYVFAPFVGSAVPVRVLDLQFRRFVNVTRDYPALVAQDAQMWWHAYGPAGVGGGGSFGVLAAWVGDECMLAKGHSAWATVGRLEAQGRLSGKPAPGYPAGAEYVKVLRTFLKKHGYCGS
ncbi:MAG: hypothetical protein ABSE77_12030 [Acidimicrobiales bacterium]